MRKSLQNIPEAPADMVSAEAAAEAEMAADSCCEDML